MLVLKTHGMWRCEIAATSSGAGFSAACTAAPPGFRSPQEQNELQDFLDCCKKQPIPTASRQLGRGE
jgi:hypothetical protein